MAVIPLFDDYLYARISEDDKKTEKGVMRQLRNSHGKSAATGGRVMGEWSDNDISALEMAPRPGFDQLMAAVTSPNPERRQRRIICQHTSRLWRNRMERASGITVLGRSKVIVLPIDGPQLDLTTAAGRMVAGMLGEVDTGESETKGERVVDAARERAFEGRANGRVLYGWTRIYQYNSAGKVVGFEDVVDEAEAAVVRQIVADLLSGKSLLQVTKGLNDRGVPAPNAGDNRKERAHDQDEAGSRWGKTSVKKIALRPANIGFRIYHRGRDDEELLPAAWPALIAVADHDKVTTLLSDPSRRIERPGSRQHLLTWGIGRCGVCDGYLRMSWKGNSRYGRKHKLYICAAKGCVGRNMTEVDSLVTEVMVRLMSREDSLELLDDRTVVAAEAMQRIEHLGRRLRAAAEDYAEERIESEQLQVITARLKPQIQEAKRLVQDAQSGPYNAVAASMVGEQARQRWEELDANPKRAVMTAFGVQVFIDRVERRGPGFDPLSVRVLPRDRQAVAKDGELVPVAFS